MTGGNDIITTALIYGGGILTALGVGKIIPGLIKWLEEKRQKKYDNQATTKKEFSELRRKVELLESNLDESRKFETQTRATLNAMIPLMKEMMKDHPDFVALLVSLQTNIIGHTNSAHGETN
jgi:flagellar biosynthesis/type III secretory pathway M-ring protein FliF/YscJ